MQSSSFAHMLKAAAIATALLVVGCSSGPKVFTNVNPSANFGDYKTYNYVETLGTDERKGYRSILSNYLVAATDREMQARGYQISSTPDLMVNFYVHTKEKIRTTTEPSMGMSGGYYGYRSGYYGGYGGYETRTTQYTEGTLNVDIVDGTSQELAWEGIAVGRVNDEVRQDLAAAARGAIGEIFQEFSYMAPGFVPPAPAEGGNDG